MIGVSVLVVGCRIFWDGNDFGGFGSTGGRILLDVGSLFGDKSLALFFITYPHFF